MSQKKYISPNRLSTFLDNLKNMFALIVHKHTLSDISDYKIDDTLSSTSINPVQNKIIDAEFDAISDAMGALELAIDNIASGSTTVKEATHATSSDSATSAIKANQDGSGNVISSTYETKVDAQTKYNTVTSHINGDTHLIDGDREILDSNLVIADVIDIITLSTEHNVMLNGEFYCTVNEGEAYIDELSFGLIIYSYRVEMNGIDVTDIYTSCDTGAIIYINIPEVTGEIKITYEAD